MPSDVCFTYCSITIEKAQRKYEIAPAKTNNVR